MRICCGGRRTRPASWAEHKANLLPMLREVVGPAEEHGVVLAIENHIDMFADELVEIITTIDSPYLGVCLDTANNLRMIEDPMMAIAKLAPFARASHIKDVTAKRGNPREFSFWPSVPLGRGLIDIPETFRLLRAQNYDGLLALEIDYLHPDYGDDVQPAVDEASATCAGCSPRRPHPCSSGYPGGPRSARCRDSTAANTSARIAPGPTVMPIALRTGTLENASNPKPATVVRFAQSSEASIRSAARARRRRCAPGLAVEEQRVIRSDRDDQQHPDQMQDRHRMPGERERRGDGQHREQQGCDHRSTRDGERSAIASSTTIAASPQSDNTIASCRYPVYSDRLRP
jgi:hypothetical protein